MMGTKICSGCKLSKSVDMFRKADRYKNGIYSRCKACVAKYTKRQQQKKSAYLKEYRAKHAEEKAAYDKIYKERNKEKIAKKKRQYRIKKRDILNEKQKEYTANHKEERAAYYKEYITRFPNKIKAQRVLQYAVQRGIILREPCEVCGEIKTEAHHPDYAKPLDVMWLCSHHHKTWHLEHGEGLNGRAA